jgi:hypothetical protein
MYAMAFAGLFDHSILAAFSNNSHPMPRPAFLPTFYVRICKRLLASAVPIFPTQQLPSLY